MYLNKNILILALQNLREQVECTDEPFFQEKVKEINAQIEIVRNTL